MCWWWLVWRGAAAAVQSDVPRALTTQREGSQGVQHVGVGAERGEPPRRSARENRMHRWC
eukprot:4676317-Prymnesium_polylepis.1